jgi:hypothetical protein
MHVLTFHAHSKRTNVLQWAVVEDETRSWRLRYVDVQMLNQPAFVRAEPIKGT